MVVLCYSNVKTKGALTGSMIEFATPLGTCIPQEGFEKIQEGDEELTKQEMLGYPPTLDYSEICCPQLGPSYYHHAQQAAGPLQLLPEPEAPRDTTVRPMPWLLG